MSVILDALKRVQDENRRQDPGAAAGVDVDPAPTAEPSDSLLRRLAGPRPDEREASDSRPVSPVIWVSLAVLAVVAVAVLAMWLMRPEYAGPRVNDGRPLLADLTGEDAAGEAGGPSAAEAVPDSVLDLHVEDGLPGDPGVVDAFAEGVRLQKAGDLAGAERAYERALELDPDDALAHYNLGVVYETTDDIDSAVRHYHEFLSLGASRYPEMASYLDRHLAWLDGRSRADRDRGPRR